MSMKKYVTIFTMTFAVACTEHPKPVRINPATVERLQDGRLPKIVLTDHAVKRLGIISQKLRSGFEVPRSSLLYDTQGRAWVYVDLGHSTYQRAEIEVLKVRDEVLEIKSKFEPSIQVVTIGAAELFGTESGIGK